MLLTGQTATGKSKILESLTKIDRKSKVLCGDVSQIYKNFPIVSNTSYKSYGGVLYQKFDIFDGRMSPLLYVSTQN